MLRLADNPPGLYPDDLVIDQVPGRWFVAHTKARFEKAFAWDLIERQTAYFLPMVRQVRYSGGRKRHGLAPLFPGYVFFAGQELQRYGALLTDRLCQVIAVADQRRLIEELSALRQAIAGGARLDPYPFAAVGKRCRVAGGPFAGLEGVVIQRDGSSRLVLQVSILGRGAEMEIDASLLEAVG